MKKINLFLALFFAFVIAFPLKGQMYQGIVKGMFVEVETKDGMNLLGTVESIENNVIVLSNDTYGEVQLETERIKKISHIKKTTLKADGYWHENKNYSRNYYGPTGMGLEKGNGYYQNIMLVWNHLAYAFTDYFTLGVDFEIVSILSRLSGESPWNGPMPVTALTPKFSFDVNNSNHIGFGTIFLFIPDTEYFLDAGISYAVYTYGDKNRNATVGFGLPFLENDFKANSPIMTLSGQYRLTPKIALLTENWFIFYNDDDGDMYDDSNTVYIGVHGMRYLARELTWDFGIATLGVAGKDSFFFPVPYISVVFPFDRNDKK